MLMVWEHSSLPFDSEKRLKDAIKDAGGSVNESGVFLSTTLTATYVSKATGMNRHLVAFIPHSQLNSDLLGRLDAG